MFLWYHTVISLPNIVTTVTNTSLLVLCTGSTSCNQWCRSYSSPSLSRHDLSPHHRFNRTRPILRPPDRHRSPSLFQRRNSRWQASIEWRNIESIQIGFGDERLFSKFSNIHAVFYGSATLWCSNLLDDKYGFFIVPIRRHEK